MRDLLGHPMTLTLPSMTLILLGFLGLAHPAQGEKSHLYTLPSEGNPAAVAGSGSNNFSLQEQPQPEQTASRIRNISSRRLPLDLLEEFRKDYPAAVEVEWQYQELPDTESMSLQSSGSIERILTLRLNSGKYHVHGYNLGQYFAATYRNNQRKSWAVLSQCENLDTDRKSAWQTAYPDWICLGYTRVFHNNLEGPHRILIGRPDHHQTLILTMGPNGKPQAIGSPKHWKRMRYARLKSQSRRLRLLFTSP